MAIAPPTPISLDQVFAGLEFLPDRAPTSADAGTWYAEVGEYRDGAMFVVHYAGNSPWERHPAGDEMVFVVDGATTMFLLVDGEEVARSMGPRDLIIVPRGVWHRFETPDGVRLMAVTPQPTDHSVERPPT